MSLCERKSGGNILCIRLSGLGDIVHAMNALSLLKDHRPDARIAWVVEERFSDLLKGHPFIDDLMVVPRQEWGGGLKNPFRWPHVVPEMLRFRRMLREQHFDVSIDFQSSIKSAWLVSAAGARKRVGFGWSVARELSPLVNNTLVKVPRGRCHRIERDLALLGPLAIPAGYRDAVLPWSSSDQREVESALEAHRRAGPLVIIHPGTSEFAAFKRWSPRGYAEVADRLADELGANVVVTWGPGERHLAEQVVEGTRGECAIGPPIGGLRQLSFLLSRADLFMGSDTGPMHMASALKVPVVALFGPKDPVQTGPYCSRSMVVTGRAECRPCTRRQCSHRRCMKSIKPAEVFDAAARVLNGEGTCRGEEEPHTRGFYFDFRLGRWKGRVDCTCSSPDFFRWLSGPEPGSGDARPVAHRQEDATTDTRPGGEFAGFDAGLEVTRAETSGGWPRRLLAAFRPSRLLRRWRGASALTRAGIEVPFHGCYVRRGEPWAREEVLVTQPVPPGTPLSTLLREGAGEDRCDGPARAGQKLLPQAAEFLKELHRAGFCHPDMTGHGLLVADSGQAGEHRLCLLDCGGVRWIGWMPVPFTDLRRGRALARFLRNVGLHLTETERESFFRAYFDGFIEGHHRQKLLLWAFDRERGVARRQREGPARESSPYMDQPGRAAG